MRFSAWTGPLVPCALLVFFAGCSRSERPGPGEQTNASRQRVTPQRTGAWFEEIAQPAGLTFRHHSGHDKKFYNPEIVCGGVGLLDYDGDGLLDIFCVQGGSLDPAVTNAPGCRLYRNLGNWKFEDVTERAGLRSATYGMGCACADYDGDGRVDIYVTGVGRNILYHNNGDGTFTDVTEKAGVAGRRWGTSCAFFDYDGDGQLDLYVANYMNWSPDREVDCFSRGGLPDYCSPMSYKSPAIDQLFHNKGNGTFEEVTHAAGIDQAYGNGLGVVCADFNGDGFPDIYVANDAMPNQLWINQKNGTFQDEALLRGCAVNALGIPEAGMGVVAVDIRQHGSLDIFITHLQGELNRLFVNTNGYFSDEVTPRGPGAISLPYTGFGVAFADFDNDGELDLFVANGRVKYGQSPFDRNDPYAEPDNLLRGLGNGEFEEILPHGGAANPLVATGRGLAVGDLDNDGALDLVVINRDGPVFLLRNKVERKGNWILLRVVDAKGRDAIGALVELESGGRLFYRQVQPNQGYCSSNDPRVHCGLGALEKVDRARVRWPFGGVEEFGPFQAGNQYEIRRGRGRPQR